MWPWLDLFFLALFADGAWFVVWLLDRDPGSQNGGTR